jgi:hypothetical protein
MKSIVQSAHATTMTEPNVMRCFCFMDNVIQFNDRRHLTPLIENGFAEPEYEVACGCGQPVGFMASRSGVLDVNVDGTVGIGNEPGTVADAVPLDRILDKGIPRVPHR